MRPASLCASANDGSSATRLLVAPERFFFSALVAQRVSEIHEHERGIRKARAQAPEQAARLRQICPASPALPRHRPGIPRVRVRGGLLCGSAFSASACRSSGEKALREIGDHLRITPVFLRRALQVLDGFGRPTEFEESYTEEMARIRVVRRKRERFLVCGDRLR